MRGLGTSAAGNCTAAHGHWSIRVERTHEGEPDIPDECPQCYLERLRADLEEKKTEAWGEGFKQGVKSAEPDTGGEG